MALIATTRRYSFRSLHALNVGRLNEKMHGHQYFLEVSFAPEQRTEVERALETSILPLVDKRDLNHLVNPSTCENVVEWIHEQLISLCGCDNIKAVALQETRKNRFVSARTDARWI